MKWKNLFVLLFVFFLGAALPSAAAGAESPVRIAYSAISGNYTALWVAAETGAFREMGLQAETLYVSGGRTLTQALVAGDVQFGFSNGGSAIRATLSGGDMLIVGVAVDRFIFALVSRPDIRTPRDLKGKKLGLIRLGGSTETASRVALERSGLTPNKDVALLQIGGMAQILAALQSRSIDVGILSPPTVWVAEKDGFRDLVDITAMNISYPNPAIVTTGAFARAHPDAVFNFMKAYAVGAKRMKTDEPLTKKILRKYTRMKDPDIIDKLYNLYALKILQKAPYIEPAVIQSAINDVAATEPRVKSVPPTRFYDDRFVKNLETSGFLKKLYR